VPVSTFRVSSRARIPGHRFLRDELLCSPRGGVDVAFVSVNEHQPPSLKLANLINMARKPRWAAGVLAGKRWTFGNLDGHVKGLKGVPSRQSGRSP
jgi:hypothetical protein